MVCEGLADGAQQLLEAPAAGARQRLFGGAQHLLGGEPQEFVDQGVLAGEPAVDGADADAGPGCDLLHRGVGARLAENFAGGRHDPVIVADSVAPGNRVAESIQTAHRAPRFFAVSATGGVRVRMRTYPLGSPIPHRRLHALSRPAIFLVTSSRSKPAQST